MILVLSSLNNEETTNAVIDWLDSYKSRYIRFNGHDLEGRSSVGITIDNSSLELELEEYEGMLEDVNVIWNRKWRDDDFYYHIEDNKQINPYLRKQLGSHLATEFFAGTRVLQVALAEKKWLTKPFYLRQITSKLHILQTAGSLGLNTPKTLLTNRKKLFLKFLEREKNVITKSISEIEIFLHKRAAFALYTTPITAEQAEAYPEIFFPSLFQKMIEKEYEIRSFYLDGQFYSMAIFSQAKEATASDFRDYDFSNPNRQVPYNLPVSIERKLHKLMKIIDVNCGSIDIIKGKDGLYYFLEVNTNGQFGMVSLPCNYYLEQRVAEKLIQEDK